MRHALIGGTGRIGSAAARALRDRGEEVVVVTRDAVRAARGGDDRIEFAEADVSDAAAIRGILSTADRALLLNPPADPSGDTDREERVTAAAIVGALEGSGVEKAWRSPPTAHGRRSTSAISGCSGISSRPWPRSPSPSR